MSKNEKRFIKEEKEMSKSKKEKLNEKAMDLAVRDESSIVYDVDYPLVINNELKVLEMYKLDNERESLVYENDEDEEVEYSRDGNFNEYRLVFEKHDGEKDNYVMDIGTYRTIDELEQCLTKCDDDQDIEFIGESEEE